MNINGASLLTSALSSVELNPQPLPPGPPDPEINSSLWKSAINPQPLPPVGSTSDVGSRNGIIIVGGRQFTLDEFCGNSPRPIPHHFGQSVSSE
jgi:hypothetical protein